MCPYCHKSQQGLSCHLRRTCRKDASPKVIKEIVNKAKDDVFNLLRHGRVYRYQLLREVLDSKDPLKRLIQELEDRNNVVTDVPSTDSAGALNAAPDAPGPSTSTYKAEFSEGSKEGGSESSGETYQWQIQELELQNNVVTGVPSTDSAGVLNITPDAPGPSTSPDQAEISEESNEGGSESSGETFQWWIKELVLRKKFLTGMPSTDSAGASEESNQGGSESSGETYQCPSNQKRKKAKRALMAQMGLDKKHSVDHPLLKEFAQYLHEDLGIDNYKQEVENVARFMYFMDPSQPSLLFVRDREKTWEYLRKLNAAHLCKQTQISHLKNIRRFLVHSSANTNLYRTDEKLSREVVMYMDFISYLQKQLSKGAAKDIVAYREKIIQRDMGLKPHDCTALLRAAKDDFLTVMGKIFDSAPTYDMQLETSEQVLVLYYLEAIIILKHLQRPGVVEHMTIEEWKNRTRVAGSHIAISVKDHTAPHLFAVFLLSLEEETWFHNYFEYVRKLLKYSKRSLLKTDCERVEEDPHERFFLSSKGIPIHNPSNDLWRLHNKYKLHNVSSQLARRTFESATWQLTNADESVMADYLTRSTATAEKDYLTKQTDNLIRAVEIIQQLGADPRKTPSRNPIMDFRSILDAFLRHHPVTVEGNVPELKVRKTYSPTEEQRLYSHWRKVQQQMRADAALARFSRRLPSESRIEKWLARQGWVKNTPSPQDILRTWKPSGDVEDIQSSAPIRKLVKSQKWKGLRVEPVARPKQRGVFAARPFQAGEVVCDYHGQVVTRVEGQKIHQEMTEEDTGYMFFFTNKDKQQMCIDAHLETCPCHPGRQTFGRLINHSRKKFNIRPRVFRMYFDDNERDVLLFLANRDIAEGEELLFNYGGKKKQFCGEGLDLEWLD
ncbi:uncharacterized protein LOC130916608 [Corythoichthys intestinalis]|uniref:uncharacterized protein LOC130916608 n=1 Tax=Corythoichthys intestinalis TaxID=161448 RepID=UPI0025A5CADA|nr:uncharacterized protein LOC130916608 [Corythoichthys intestinalis]